MKQSEIIPGRKYINNAYSGTKYMGVQIRAHLVGLVSIDANGQAQICGARCEPEFVLTPGWLSSLEETDDNWRRIPAYSYDRLKEDAPLGVYRLVNGNQECRVAVIEVCTQRLFLFSSDGLSYKELCSLRNYSFIKTNEQFNNNIKIKS